MKAVGMRRTIMAVGTGGPSFEDLESKLSRRYEILLLSVRDEATHISIWDRQIGQGVTLPLADGARRALAGMQPGEKAVLTCRLEGETRRGSVVRISRI